MVRLDGLKRLREAGAASLRATSNVDAAVGTIAGESLRAKNWTQPHCGQAQPPEEVSATPGGVFLLQHAPWPRRQQAGVLEASIHEKDATPAGSAICVRKRAARQNARMDRRSKTSRQYSKVRQAVSFVIGVCQAAYNSVAASAWGRRSGCVACLGSSDRAGSIRARSLSPNATLRISAGRTFSAMPRSSSQTSPRTGFIFLCIKHSEERIRRVSGFFVVQRARIERNGAAKELGCEDAFLFLW